MVTAMRRRPMCPTSRLVSIIVLTACSERGAAPPGDGGLADGAQDATSDAGQPACGSAPTPIAVAPAHRVIPVYLVASDTSPADVDARAFYFDRSLSAIQNWYSTKMGAAYNNATFAYDPPLRLSSVYTRAQWDDFGKNGFLYSNGTRSNGCGMWYGALDELPPLLSAAGLPALFTSGVYYLVVTGGGSGGGCGAGGMAAVEELELDRIRGRCPNAHYDECTRSCADPEGLGTVDPWCQESIHRNPAYACTAVGAFAHEIGHGFGLPHGSSRTGPDLVACANKTLMDIWWEYDRTATLCDPDRRDLMASGYFAPP